MENISLEKKNPDNSIENANSPKIGLSEYLNRKYPYLTAFIGCIVMYVLAGAVAGIIFIAPEFLFAKIIDEGTYIAKAQLFILALRLVLAYYGFKYVINKNLLPYISR